MLLTALNFLDTINELQCCNVATLKCLFIYYGDVMQELNTQEIEVVAGGFFGY